MNYTVRMSRLTPTTYEFTTLNAEGETVSTVRMSRERATALGLLG